MINYMNRTKKFSPTKYTSSNPSKARAIKQAVKQGMKQYGETFKKLANV